VSQMQATLLKITKEVAAQVEEDTPKAVIALAATQLLRARDAGQKVDDEGSVVRDLKGCVIAHPAIAIEMAASKLAADIIGKNKRGW
jgi:hypothetical protein